jgi:hypothetical protein
MLWTGNGLKQHKVLDVAVRTLADTATYVIRYEQAGASAEFPSAMSRRSTAFSSIPGQHAVAPGGVAESLTGGDR